MYAVSLSSLWQRLWWNNTVKGSLENIYDNAQSTGRAKKRRIFPSVGAATIISHYANTQFYCFALIKLFSFIFLLDCLQSACARLQHGKRGYTRLAKELSFLLFNFHLDLFIHLYGCCCCCHRAKQTPTHTHRQWGERATKNNAADWKIEHTKNSVCWIERTFKSAQQTEERFLRPKRNEFMKHLNNVKCVKWEPYESTRESVGITHNKIGDHFVVIFCWMFFFCILCN